MWPVEGKKFCHRDKDFSLKGIGLMKGIVAVSCPYNIFFYNMLKL